MKPRNTSSGVIAKLNITQAKLQSVKKLKEEQEEIQYKKDADFHFGAGKFNFERAARTNPPPPEGADVLRETALGHFQQAQELYGSKYPNDHIKTLFYIGLTYEAQGQLQSVSDVYSFTRTQYKTYEADKKKIDPQLVGQLNDKIKEVDKQLKQFEAKKDQPVSEPAPTQEASQPAPKPSEPESKSGPAKGPGRS